MSKNTDELKLSLLENGGVDNWDGYGDAFSTFLEYNPELSHDELFDNAKLKLAALESAGVNNWTWYEDSLSEYSEYCDYLDGLDEHTTPIDFEDFKANLETEEKKEAERIQLEIENQRLKDENDRLKQQEEMRKIIQHPNVYDYIVQNYPNAKSHEDIYHAIVDGDVYNMFDTNILTNDEFVNAKREAIAEGNTTMKDFKIAARQMFADAILENRKIDLFIRKYLVQTNQIMPSYISFIKLGTNANIIISAKSIEVVMNTQYMIPINTDKDLTAYLMKVKKLPKVYKHLKTADASYEKELSLITEKLNTIESNIHRTRKRLGLDNG